MANGRQLRSKTRETETMTLNVFFIVGLITDQNIDRELVIGIGNTQDHFGGAGFNC